MVWENKPAKVYHGTTDRYATAIRRNGVDLSKGRGAADFGRGFYLTTSLYQAQQWANQKFRNVRSGRGHHAAAVVAFHLDRDLAGKLGDHLTFVLADFRIPRFRAL